MEIKLNYKYIISLLNMVSENCSKILVKAPLFNLNLIEFNYMNLDYFKIIDSDEYNSYIYSIIYGVNKKVMDEIPSYRHFIDALLISGIIAPRNIENILKYIEQQLEYRRIDPLKYPKPFILGLDTNVLYLNFISNFLDRLREKPMIIISDSVVKEISGKIDKKVRDISSLGKIVLRNILSYKGYLYNGMESFRARRALIAYSELKDVEEKYVTKRISGKCCGDRKIVESYSNFVRDSRYSLTLLTFDEKIRGYSSMRGISSIYIEPPISNSYSLNYRNLIKLLYILSIYFIAISIRCESYTIEVKSIWSGKRLEDWLNKNVLINTNVEEIKEIRDRAEKILQLISRTD